MRRDPGLLGQMTPDRTFAEPAWLPAEVVVQIVRRAVSKTGKPFGIRDTAMLESALARPRNQFHYAGQKDVLVLAASLLFAIARNHPFVQGNKRAGFTAMMVFLRANGYGLTMRFDETLGQRVLDVLAGVMTEDAFCEMLRPFTSDR